MRIIGTDEMHLVAAHSLVTHPYVRLDVLKHVAEVNGAVSVRERTGHQNLA
ncbi:hypothetical protein GBS0709_21010 [Edwardsiella tarda]|nr:hypothetical protein GBS0709_21010 [Edwardsiella tarda]